MGKFDLLRKNFKIMKIFVESIIKLSQFFSINIFLENIK